MSTVRIPGSVTCASAPTAAGAGGEGGAAGRARLAFLAYPVRDGRVQLVGARKFPLYLLCRAVVNPHRSREMIVFFSETPNMFVTKLAKLMFYTDFLHYKEYTTSITGLAYAHLSRGPVPERYERIRDDVVENWLVRIEDRLGKTWAGEVLVAERAPRLDVFSADELQVLECVRAQLGVLSSKAVSDLSHSETAYTSTAMGDHISYRAARELSLAVSGTDD